VGKRQNSINVPFLVGALFAAVGLVFCGVSANSFLSSRSFFAKALEADGVVVGLTEIIYEDNDDRESILYAPEVVFSTADGEEVTFTSGVGSSPPNYRIGQQVKVFYEPTEPQNAKVDSWLERWFDAAVNDRPAADAQIASAQTAIV